MQRREFLKQAILTSAIPLLADSMPKISFIHVTDAHMDLHEPESLHSMELMVKTINSRYPHIDFVLFGGDNFNNNANGNKDALVFKKILSKLKVPAYAVRGNKESSPKGDQEINLAQFEQLFFTKDMLTHTKNWAIEKKGYMILGLDSCIEHHNNGLYTKETLDFAESMLRRGRPTIILNHHPYLNFWHSTNKDNIHKYVLNNTHEAQRRLFGYKNLIMTLSGHIHIDDPITHIGHVRVATTQAFKVSLGGDHYPMRLVEIEGGRITEKLIST